MSYVFILFLLLQTTNSQITVTVLDDKEVPVTGEIIELSSQGQTIGSCQTNANGRCTITLEALPADGFIRGAIVIPSRGQRPVIWPGGPLEISIILDSAGQIFVPSDYYVTQTPAAILSPTGTQTPTSTETPSGTETPSLPETPSTTEAPSLSETANPKTNFKSRLVQLILIVAIMIIGIIYFVISKRIQD